MYERFHCGARAVLWDADYAFEDYDMDGDGIVHECHCTKCGAWVTYYVPVNNNENEEG